MSHAQISFDSPSGLLASIPGVLGFVPRKSAVVIALESNQIGAVLRVDLGSELVDSLGQLAAVTASAGADSAILVVVDQDEALCPLCNDDHRRLGEGFAAALATHEVGLAALYTVDAVAAGGHWLCLDGVGKGTHGTLDDPGSSPMAAAAVLDGRRLYSRREDMLAVIAVTDPTRTASLAAVIQRACADSDASQWRADAETAVALVRGGADLTDMQIAQLACSLRDGMVRDALYGLAVGPDAGRVEDTFAWLSRTLPDPWRADALAMHAFLVYARGDGPLAGLSLEAALTINPAHRMATLLDKALQSGMHPNRIRELAQSRRSGSSVT